MATPNLSDLIATLEENLPTLIARYQIESIGIFGSFVKNEQDQDSDVDMLVSFSEVPGLFSYIELENKLGSILGLKVDLVMEDALNLESQKEFWKMWCGWHEKGALFRRLS